MNQKYNAIQKLSEIKVLLKTGQISYEQAEIEAKQYLLNINERIVELSRKMKQKPRLITFSNFMK